MENDVCFLVENDSNTYPGVRQEILRFRKEPPQPRFFLPYPKSNRFATTKCYGIQNKEANTVLEIDVINYIYNSRAADLILTTITNSEWLLGRKRQKLFRWWPFLTKLCMDGSEKTFYCSQDTWEIKCSNFHQTGNNYRLIGKIDQYFH